MLVILLLRRLWRWCRVGRLRLLKLWRLLRRRVRPRLWRLSGWWDRGWRRLSLPGRTGILRGPGRLTLLPVLGRLRLRRHRRRYRLLRLHGRLRRRWHRRRYRLLRLRLHGRLRRWLGRLPLPLWWLVTLLFVQVRSLAGVSGPRIRFKEFCGPRRPAVNDSLILFRVTGEISLLGRPLVLTRSRAEGF